MLKAEKTFVSIFLVTCHLVHEERSLMKCEMNVCFEICGTGLFLISSKEILFLLVGTMVTYVGHFGC